MLITINLIYVSLRPKLNQEFLYWPAVELAEIIFFQLEFGWPWFDNFMCPNFNVKEFNFLAPEIYEKYFMSFFTWWKKSSILHSEWICLSVKLVHTCWLANLFGFHEFFQFTWKCVLTLRFQRRRLYYLVWLNALNQKLWSYNCKFCISWLFVIKNTILNNKLNKSFSYDC